MPTKASVALWTLVAGFLLFAASLCDGAEAIQRVGLRTLPAPVDRLLQALGITSVRRVGFSALRRPPVFLDRGPGPAFGIHVLPFSDQSGMSCWPPSTYR